MNTPKELKVKGSGVSIWADAKKSADDRLAAMWREAYAQGAKAFHPDDGWVDRKNGTLRLQYPFVRLPGIQAGDLIAVTDYVDWKMVKVIQVDQSDPKQFLIEKKLPEKPIDEGNVVMAIIGIVVFTAYGIFRAIHQ